MDAYLIGVKIAMTSNHAPLLAAMSRELLGIDNQVKRLEAGWNRVKVAMAGALAVWTGGEMLRGMGHLVEKGEEFVQIQHRMRAAGVENQQVAEAVAKAWQMTDKYKNVSVTQALKTIEEARGVFGDTHQAIQEIDAVVRMRSALQAAGFEQDKAKETVSQSYSAIKTAEVLNKFKPEEFAHAIDMMTRVAIAFGGRVNPSVFYGAVKKASVALQNTNEDYLYGVFPGLVQEFGPTAGVMMQTAWNKFVAGIQNRSYSLSFMEKMGLLDLSDPSKYTRSGAGVHLGMGKHPHLSPHLHISKAGIVTRIDPSIIKGSDVAATDFMGWMHDYVLPALQKHGYDTPIKLAQAFGQMGVDRNAVRFLTALALQMQRLEKDKKLQQAVSGDYYGELQKSPAFAKGAFQAQLYSLETALGAPLVDVAMSGLYRIATALGEMAQKVAAADPENIRVFGEAVASLAASLVAGGSVAIIAALPGLLGLGGIIAGVLAALGLMVAFNWDRTKTASQNLSDFARWIDKTFLSVNGILPLTAIRNHDWKAWDAWRDGFRKWVHDFLDSIPPLKALRDAVGEFGTSIANAAKAARDSIVGLGDAIIGGLTSMFSRIMDWLKGTTDWLKGHDHTVPPPIPMPGAYHPGEGGSRRLPGRFGFYVPGATAFHASYSGGENILAKNNAELHDVSTKLETLTKVLEKAAGPGAGPGSGGGAGGGVGRGGVGGLGPALPFSGQRHGRSHGVAPYRDGDSDAEGPAEGGFGHALPFFGRHRHGYGGHHHPHPHPHYHGAHRRAARIGRHHASRHHGAGSAVLPTRISNDPLLNAISKAEGTLRRGYNDSLAHWYKGTLTDKTLDQVYAIQGEMQAHMGHGKTAIGRYQFVRSTLRRLQHKFHLPGSTKFTPELQDRLARALYIEKGYNEVKAGRMTPEEFVNRIGRDRLWDSFPSSRHPAISTKEAADAVRATIARDRAGKLHGTQVIPPPRGHKNEIHVNLNADGRKLASVTTYHQTRMGYSPARGASRADASGFPHVDAMSYVL